LAPTSVTARGFCCRADWKSGASGGLKFGGKLKVEGYASQELR
jgi:hypothetical protein